MAATEASRAGLSRSRARAHHPPMCGTTSASVDQPGSGGTPIRGA
jgi:hypothetical protein